MDDYLRQEMLSAVDLLTTDGTLVVWLTHPPIRNLDRGRVPETPFPEWDPARMKRFNALVFELETQRPGQVRAIDLAAYMRELPMGEFDPNYRPDGVHLTPEGAANIAEAWLGEELLRVYREQAKRSRGH